jgi:hypothetical protein
VGQYLGVDVFYGASQLAGESFSSVGMCVFLHELLFRPTIGAETRRVA